MFKVWQTPWFFPYSAVKSVFSEVAFLSLITQNIEQMIVVSIHSIDRLTQLLRLI